MRGLRARELVLVQVHERALVIAAAAADAPKEVYPVDRQNWMMVLLQLVVVGWLICRLGLHPLGARLLESFCGSA